MRELGALIVGNLVGFYLFRELDPTAPKWVPMLAAVVMGALCVVQVRERRCCCLDGRGPPATRMRTGAVYVDRGEALEAVRGFHDIGARPAADRIRALKAFTP